MKIRKISASYLFTLTSKPLKNGIVVVDENGIIEDIIDTGGELRETEGLEHYSGIICPGFINAHCHLELSHLRGKVESGIGLPGFLNQINLFRKENDEIRIHAMQQADRLMMTNGIVAIADICNSSLSLEIKEKSSIYYYTFIECFGFLPERAQRAMEYAGFIGYLYEAAKQPFSITAHAPYSVSDQLWEYLIQKATENNFTLSVHHQESAEEDKMFQNKNGELIDHYTHYLKLDTEFWQPSGKSSTETIVDKVPSEIDLLLVHNTYIDAEKLSVIKKSRVPGNTYLVTCPKSNQYIENRLPDYQLLKNSGFQVCIGTDSLASNNTLSILEEMKMIGRNNQDISLEELLKWACLNGAKALKIDHWAGNIERGKRPGLNLITGVDLKGMRLNEYSKVKKMI